MHDLYSIFSIFVTGGLLLACGLMLLFVATPAGELPGNYRKARFMMAGAYLFFAPAGIVEYLFQTSAGAQGIALMQTVTLSIAVFQAALFTFAMLALLDVRFPGWRRVAIEASAPVMIVVTIFCAYVLSAPAVFGIIFYALTGVYALMLARYTGLFIARYRRFRRQMDNYFSDAESERVRWVAFSFFAALAVGVTALLSALFMSTAVALLFAVFFDIFYVYFAIRFVNYAHMFQSIERAMDVEHTGERLSIEDAGVVDRATATHADAFALLEVRIDEWIAAKGFTAKGLTIDILAAHLYTNRKYISVYINTRKRQTFREWINRLRIEEAKTLLLRHPDMPVHEIAASVGIATVSHFGKQFRDLTGLSPSGWRQKESKAGPP